MTSKLFTSYHDPIPLARSSSIYIICMYMYIVLHIIHTGCNNPPSRIHAIYHIYLPNTATGCIKNTGCSFNYNHNHKYMYVCINLCSRGDTNTYTLLLQEREQICINGKNGVVVSTVDSCCWVMECAYMCRRTFYYYAIATSLIMMYIVIETITRYHQC